MVPADEFDEEGDVRVALVVGEAVEEKVEVDVVLNVVVNVVVNVVDGLLIVLVTFVTTGRWVWGNSGLDTFIPSIPFETVSGCNVHQVGQKSFGVKRCSASNTWESLRRVRLSVQNDHVWKHMTYRDERKWNIQRRKHSQDNGTLTRGKAHLFDDLLAHGSNRFS